MGYRLKLTLHIYGRHSIKKPLRILKISGLTPIVARDRIIKMPGLMMMMTMMNDDEEQINFNVA